MRGSLLIDVIAYILPLDPLCCADMSDQHICCYTVFLHADTECTRFVKSALENPVYSTI